MSPTLRLSLWIALLQGVVLCALHSLTDGGYGVWSGLPFLLPVYAVSVGVPLTWHLLAAQMSLRALAGRVAAVGLVLATTGAYLGWVNGPVGDLRAPSGGSVLLFAWLTLIAWFVALPFLRLGLRESLSRVGYVGLFDEAWRVAITLAFAGLFVGLFWGLLGLFVSLFKGLGISWPRALIFAPPFYYPATCLAASVAIGLTDIKPDMFRALRHLLLGVLRWLTVLAAGMVLVFLAAMLVEGVEALWQTRFATWALIGLSISLLTLYNAVYQDGSRAEPLPRPLDRVVRAALVAGPALAVLAVWAVTLRVRQHGLSEDRLHVLTVIAILASYLVGYCAVALRGVRAPFEIRHVNVVMALVIVTTLVLVHSPVLDFKRIAVTSQAARALRGDGDVDFNYLRHHAGRHGILALQALSTSGSSVISERARIALAEVNRGDLLARGRDLANDRTRLRARVEVYPRGSRLPDDLVERLLMVLGAQRWRLACVDAGPTCAVILIDLDGDGQEEAVVLASAETMVYARLSGGWVRVGQLVSGRSPSADGLRKALEEGQWRAASPGRYHGLELGTSRYVFVPSECDPSDPTCS